MLEYALFLHLNFKNVSQRALRYDALTNHVSGSCLPWYRQPIAPGSVPCQPKDSPSLSEPCQRTKQGPVTFPHLAPSWAPSAVI